MKTVYKLGTDIEHHYSSDVSVRTALKTSYALDDGIGLATRLATDYGETMDHLNDEIKEGNYFLSLGDYTIKKEGF